MVVLSVIVKRSQVVARKSASAAVESDPGTQRPLRISKSNELITASYRLTLNEQRLILAAISRLDPRRPMPKRVAVSAIDYAEIYGVQLKHAYKQMSTAADELYERDIDFTDSKSRQRHRWIDAAKYTEGTVELSFTIHVIPYLTMLYNKVTTYDLRRVARVDSVYALRLFEMLMQFRKTGWLYIEVERFRHAMGLTDEYKRFNSLRQRVIDPAIAELKIKCKLDVECERITTGRTVVAIKFIFQDQAQMTLPLPDDFDNDFELEGDQGLRETTAETLEPEWFDTRPIGELDDDIVEGVIIEGEIVSLPSTEKANG
ncbi:replication initiation protein (plasmid) [Stutzerimonas degradans]|nr:replication initiation protein [Stutzerimonas degradans]